MLPQFIQYLIHLKRCQDRLYKHRCFDRTVWNTQSVFSQRKHIIPESRLQVILQLGQVKVGTSPVLQQRFDVVEEVEAKIEKPSRNLFAVDEHMLLRQMPATRAHKQSSRRLLQRVLLSFWRGIADSTVDGIAQVNLTLHRAFPGG